MAELEKPFPPGRYQVVVVGSGPGGLQTSYFLNRLGINHAVISADELPGGMFQKFPIFQRLISWSKPHAPAPRKSRAYEWYDWNSLLCEESENRQLVLEFMDGSSYFPSRTEMEQGLAAFAKRAGIKVRYGCRWESTQRDPDGFTINTTDGPYSCEVAIFAVGTTTPWKPDIKGIDQVPHYVEAKAAREYEDKTVFILGKRNSGMEIADALLPTARRIMLGSPRPAKLSVTERALVGARARYLQPYEDFVLGGGHFLLDVSIESIERTSTGYRVHAMSPETGKLTCEADEVIAATGFTTPMLDLPDIGVATFNQGRLPAQTTYWESASVPKIYFAGCITQGGIELRKYGSWSNSAAVHGFRYNARVMAEHIAEKHFSIPRPRVEMNPADLISYLLAEATRAPELWNQRAYLTRVITLESGNGNNVMHDEGILPLADFVDTGGPDAVAMTVETDDNHEIHPAVYLKRKGKVEEHLLAPNQLLNFETPDHRMQLESILKPYL